MSKRLQDDRFVLISVLLTTYKPRWLDEAGLSVLSQTYPHFELLVLDDEPSATTAATVEAWHDCRVRYLPTDRNRGPAAAHQRGIDSARGDCLAIINHDDVWEHDFLATLVDALDSSPQAVVAFSDHYVIDVDGLIDEAATEDTSAQWGRTELQVGYHDSDSVAELAIVRQQIPIAVSALFRRGGITRTIPERVGGHYDIVIAHQLARTGMGAIYVRRRLARYRCHNENLTRVRSVARSLERLHAWRQIVVDRHLPSSCRRFAFRQLLLSARGLIQSILLSARNRLRD